MLEILRCTQNDTAPRELFGFGLLDRAAEPRLRLNMLYMMRGNLPALRQLDVVNPIGERRVDEHGQRTTCVADHA